MLKRSFDFLLFVLCFFVVFLFPGWAQNQGNVPSMNQPTGKSGKFLVFMKDRQVGTETFTVSDSELTGEVSLDLGVPIKAKTHIRYKNQNLEVFELEQGTAKITADTSTDPIKLTTPTGVKEIKMPPGTIVLETVFMHHYSALVTRYDQKAGGKQSFQALAPSFRQVVPMTLELKDRMESLILNQPTKLLRFEALAPGNVKIEILTDDQLNLLMIHVPVQSFTAVREGFESLRPQTEPPLNSDKYDSVEVEVPGEGVKLAGTLTLPKNGVHRHPAVVLITGSGPQDRDEDTPPILNTHLFRLIADRLSSAGIAVLRCDDRGVAKSTGDFSSVTLQELFSDAQAQVKFLRSRPEIDPTHISVLGHSEGGYIAPYVAAHDPKIRAVVILAGPSRSLDFVMNEQLEFQSTFPELPEDVRNTAKSLLEPTRKLVADVKANQPTLEQNGKKIMKLGRIQWNFEYFRQHFAYDPLATIKKVRCPVLILQGDRDLLVQKYHAEALAQALTKAGNKQATVKIFPYLTHLFTPFPINNPDQDAQGKTNTVSEEFLNALRDWGIKHF